MKRNKLRNAGLLNQSSGSAPNPRECKSSVNSEDARDTTSKGVADEEARPRVVRRSMLPQPASVSRNVDGVKPKVEDKARAAHLPNTSTAKTTLASIGRSQSLKSRSNIRGIKINGFHTSNGQDVTCTEYTGRNELEGAESTASAHLVGIKGDSLVQSSAKPSQHVTSGGPRNNDGLSTEVSRTIGPRGGRIEVDRGRVKAVSKPVVLQQDSKQDSLGHRSRHRSIQNQGELVTEDVTISRDTKRMTTKARVRRPEFSALQHEKVPSQATQGPVPTLLQKPVLSQRHTIRLPQHMTDLRDELLYLHLLHRDSEVILGQWQMSAQNHYRNRFEGLAASHAQLLVQEREFQEQVNATAVMKWCSATQDLTSEGRIRTLSRVIREVWATCEADGRYAVVIQAFEHWYAESVRIREERTAGNDGDVGPGGRIGFVEGIGDGWKSEVSSLQTQTRGWLVNIRGLGPAQEPSLLSRCLNALLALFPNMVEEMETIVAIEAEIVAQERHWVQRSIDRLANDVTSGTRLPR